MLILDKLKKYSMGFISVIKLEDHYTKASHRIFLMSEFGIVTIFWNEQLNKLDCKSKKFLQKLKQDKEFKELI